MKPVGRRMTVDFHGAHAVLPEAGHIVRELAADGRLKDYARVLSVRQVKVRVSRGETARFVLWVQRLEAAPIVGGTFTVTDYPRKPKVDRFSPLL